MSEKEPQSKLPRVFLLVGSGVMLAGIILPVLSVLSPDIRARVVQTGGIAHYSTTLLLCGFFVLGFYFLLQRHKKIEGLLHDLDSKSAGQDVLTKKIDTLTEGVKRVLVEGVNHKQLEEISGRIEKMLQTAGTAKAPVVDLTPLRLSLEEIRKEIKTQKTEASPFVHAPTPAAAPAAAPAPVPAAPVPVPAPAPAPVPAVPAGPSPAEKLLLDLQKRLGEIETLLKQKPAEPAVSAKSLEGIEQGIKTQLAEQNARWNSELGKLGSSLMEQSKVQTQELRSDLVSGQAELRKIQEGLAQSQAAIQNIEPLQGLKTQVSGVEEKLNGLTASLRSESESNLQKIQEALNSQLASAAERHEALTQKISALDSKESLEKNREGLDKNQQSLEKIQGQVAAVEEKLNSFTHEEKFQQIQQQLQSVQEQIESQIEFVGGKIRSLGDSLQSETSNKLQELQQGIESKHESLTSALNSLRTKDQLDEIQYQVLEVEERLKSVGSRVTAEMQTRFDSVESGFSHKQKHLEQLLGSLKHEEKFEKVQKQVDGIGEKLGLLGDSLRESVQSVQSQWEELKQGLDSKHESLSQKLISLDDKKALEEIQAKVNALGETVASLSSSLSAESERRLLRLHEALANYGSALGDKHTNLMHKLDLLGDKAHLERIQNQLSIVGESVEAKLDAATGKLHEETQSKLQALETGVNEKQKNLEQMMSLLSAGHEDKLSRVQRQVEQVGESLHVKHESVTQKLNLLGERKHLEEIQTQLAAIRDKAELSAAALREETQSRWQIVEAEMDKKQKSLEQKLQSLGQEESEGFAKLQDQLVRTGERLSALGQSLGAETKSKLEKLQEVLVQQDASMEEKHLSLKKMLSLLQSKAPFEEVQAEVVAAREKVEAAVASLGKESDARWKAVEAEMARKQKSLEKMVASLEYKESFSRVQKQISAFGKRLNDLERVLQSQSELQWRELQSALEMERVSVKDAQQNLTQFLQTLRKDFAQGQQDLAKKLAFKEMEANFERVQGQLFALGENLNSMGQSLKAETDSKSQDLLKDSSAKHEVLLRLLNLLQSKEPFEQIQKQVLGLGEQLRGLGSSFQAESESNWKELRSSLEAQRNASEEKQQALTKILASLGSKQHLQELQNQVAVVQQKVEDSAVALQAEVQSKHQALESGMAEKQKSLLQLLKTLDSKEQFAKLQRQLADGQKQFVESNKEMGVFTQSLQQELRAKWQEAKEGLEAKYDTLKQKLASLDFKKQLEKLDDRVDSVSAKLGEKLSEKLTALGNSIKAESESKSSELQAALEAQREGIEKKQNILEKLVNSLGHEARFQELREQLTETRQQFLALGQTVLLENQSGRKEVEVGMADKHARLMQTFNSLQELLDRKHQELVQGLIAAKNENAKHEERFQEVKKQIDGVGQRVAEKIADKIEVRAGEIEECVAGLLPVLHEESDSKWREIREVWEKNHTAWEEKHGAMGRTIAKLQLELQAGQAELASALVALQSREPFEKIQSQIAAVTDSMRTKLENAATMLREESQTNRQALETGISEKHKGLEQTLGLMQSSQSESLANAQSRLEEMRENLDNFAQSLHEATSYRWEEMREDQKAKHESLAQKLSTLGEKQELEEIRNQILSTKEKLESVAGSLHEETQSKLQSVEEKISSTRDKLQAATASLHEETQSKLESIEDEIAATKEKLKTTAASLHEETQSKLHSMEEGLVAQEKNLLEAIGSLGHEEEFEETRDQIEILGRNLHSLGVSLREDSDSKSQELHQSLDSKHENLVQVLAMLSSKEQLETIQDRIVVLGSKLGHMEEALQAGSEERMRELQSNLKQEFESLAQAVDSIEIEEPLRAVAVRVEGVAARIDDTAQFLAEDSQSKHEELHSALAKGQSDIEEKHSALTKILTALQSEKPLQKIQAHIASQISGLSEKLKSLGQVLREDNNSKAEEMQKLLEKQQNQLSSQMGAQVAAFNTKIKGLSRFLHEESKNQTEGLHKVLEANRVSFLEEQTIIVRSLASFQLKLDTMREEWGKILEASSDEEALLEVQNQVQDLSQKLGHLYRSLQSELENKTNELSREYNRIQDLAMKKEDAHALLRATLQKEIHRLDEDHKKVSEILARTQETDASIERVLRGEIQRLTGENEDMNAKVATQSRTSAQMESELRGQLKALNDANEANAKKFDQLQKDHQVKLQSLANKKDVEHTARRENLQQEVIRLESERIRLGEVLARTQKTDDEIEKVLRAEIQRLTAENKNVGDAFEKINKVDTEIGGELRKQLKQLTDLNSSYSKNFGELRKELEKTNSLFTPDKQWTEESYAQTLKLLKEETDKLISMLDLQEQEAGKTTPPAQS